MKLFLALEGLVSLYYFFENISDVIAIASKAKLKTFCFIRILISKLELNTDYKNVSCIQLNLFKKVFYTYFASIMTRV